jgi:non-heme chloroperoxidase
MLRTLTLLRVWLLVALCCLSLASPLAAQAGLHSDRFQTSDGVSIHYVESGSGPAILFIPGWTMPATIWQPQISHFAQHYHVIAVDPRSQGESEKAAEGNYPERRARDYKELVDHLKLNSVVLVGWSMGVPELMSYVEQFGTDNLGGLVLVDGIVWLDPKNVASFLQFEHRIQIDHAKFANAFVKSMYQKPQTADYLDGVAKASLQTPTNTALALIVGMLARTDWTPALSKVGKTPLLYTYEPHLNDQVEKIKAVLPSARFEAFEDAGHALFVDDAERFNSLLDSFMSSATQAGK